MFVVGVVESRDRMVSQSKIQLRQKTALLEAYVSKILEANDMVLQGIRPRLNRCHGRKSASSERLVRFLATQKQFLKHSGVIALVDRNGKLFPPAKAIAVVPLM